jgi:hypothetical protein
VVVALGNNRAVHSHRAIPADDALVGLGELFHLAFWLARSDRDKSGLGVLAHSAIIVAGVISA